MECGERLQLIRALYALSQQELAELVGAGRSTIALVENGHRWLSKWQAAALSSVLHVDAGWLTHENCLKPLQGEPLLIVEYPPRRILAVARNIQQLRLNVSISTIKKLWPLFLKENPLQRCWLAEVSDGAGKILLLLFKSDQGILFRLSDVGSLTDSLLYGVVKVAGVDVSRVEIDDTTFEAITSTPLEVGKFLERCGIGQDLRGIFMLTAQNVLPAQATQVKTLSGKTRRSVLEKVCADMIEHNIKLFEIEDYLKNAGHAALTLPRQA